MRINGEHVRISTLLTRRDDESGDSFFRPFACSHQPHAAFPIEEIPQLPLRVGDALREAKLVKREKLVKIFRRIVASGEHSVILTRVVWRGSSARLRQRRLCLSV